MPAPTRLAITDSLRHQIADLASPPAPPLGLTTVARPRGVFDSGLNGGHFCLNRLPLSPWPFPPWDFLLSCLPFHHVALCMPPFVWGRKTTQLNYRHTITSVRAHCACSRQLVRFCCAGGPHFPSGLQMNIHERTDLKNAEIELRRELLIEEVENFWGILIAEWGTPAVPDYDSGRWTLEREKRHRVDLRREEREEREYIYKLRWAELTYLLRIPNEKATIIQTAWRGHVARRDVEQKKRQAHYANQILQNNKEVQELEARARAEIEDTREVCSVCIWARACSVRWVRGFAKGMPLGDRPRTGCHAKASKCRCSTESTSGACGSDNACNALVVAEAV